MGGRGAETMPAWRDSGLRWLWLAAAVLVVDQLTKLWVSAALRLYEEVVLLPFLNVTLVHNTGAAFSFLSSASGWQRWFFILLALAVSAAIVVWLRRIGREQRWVPAGLALILGGALGNVWDRLAYGHVVDFIDVHYGGWHWPAFNAADSAITVGAAILILDALWSPR